MSADDLSRHRAELNRHACLLTTMLRYLDADLATSHLEGRRLDANTRTVAELERRVAELEHARLRRPTNAELVELARRLEELGLIAGRDGATS